MHVQKYFQLPSGKAGPRDIPNAAVLFATYHNAPSGYYDPISFNPYQSIQWNPSSTVRVTDEYLHCIHEENQDIRKYLKNLNHNLNFGSYPARCECSFLFCHSLIALHKILLAFRVIISKWQNSQ